MEEEGVDELVVVAAEAREWDKESSCSTKESMRCHMSFPWSNEGKRIKTSAKRCTDNRRIELTCARSFFVC